MTFYKIIKDGEFVGIATSGDMRRFQTKHRIIIISNEDNAQYIQRNELLYRDAWMAPLNSDTEYIEARVINITQEEYEDIVDAIDSGEEIIPESEEQPVQEEPIPVNAEEEITVDFVKQRKIAELNKACNAVIEGGFDLELSDGKVHHFSLTQNDQLNLITLSTMIASGEQAIPYHADGELCIFYSVQDTQAILNGATMWKTFHVTYVNSLKAYVNSRRSINVISAIEYGMEVPEEYQSDVLKTLLKAQNE